LLKFSRNTLPKSGDQGCLMQFVRLTHPNVAKGATLEWATRGSFFAQYNSDSCLTGGVMARRGIFSGIHRGSLLDTARTSLAAVAAMLLARLLKMPEYYWAPISTIVIIQSTIPPRTLAWQRFVGTAVGAVLGAALATFFHANAIVYAVGMVLCGVLSFLLHLGGAYRFAAITLSIILLIPRATAPWTVSWHRFLEVSLGVAVALVMTTVWPLTKKAG
jgi:hypothetical protein